MITSGPQRATTSRVLIPGMQDRQTAVMSGKQVSRTQGNDLVGFGLCHTGLQQIIHVIEQLHFLSRHWSSSTKVTSSSFVVCTLQPLHACVP